MMPLNNFFFFFQAADGIRDFHVTGVQTCALPICSADGTHWTRMGAARLAGLPSMVQVGLFVTSPDAVTDENAGPALASALFDHVTVSGTRPGSGWTGDNVAGPAYASVSGGFRQTGGTFTVRGS